MATRIAFAQAPAAEPPVLQQVIVLGLDGDAEAQLRGLLPIETGEPLAQQTIAELEQSLHDSELPIEKMRISIRRATLGEQRSRAEDDPFADGVVLVFDFRPPPTISSLKLFPLVAMNAAQLRAAMPIKEGALFDARDLPATLQAMRDALTSQGLSAPLITPHQVPLSSDTLALQFIIEGQQPAVLHRASFKGAGWPLWGPGSKLRPFMKKLEPIPFDKGSTVTAALARRVEQEAGLVMRAQGYLRAESTLQETTVTEKGLRITYVIERGPRFRIGQRTVTGAVFPDPAFWTPAHELFAEKYFTIDRIRDLEKALTRQAQSKGYMAPDVRLAYVPQVDEKRVTINAVVNEGTTSSLGLVRFQRIAPERGYGKSDYHKRFAPPMLDQVIRRQIRARQGEPLDVSVLDDAKSRLEALGIYEEVDVETTASEDLYVRDLVAKIKERRTGEVTTSLGWADQAGPVARVSYNETNLWGKGDRFSVGVGGQSQGFGGEFSYLDRNWALGERLMGATREPYLLWSGALTGQAYDEYSEQRIGGALQFGYLIGGGRGRWSNAWETRLEQISFDTFGREDRFEEEFNDYVAQTLAYRLTYDALNLANRHAQRGFLFSSEIAGGQADGMLLRWMNRAEWHQPISRRWGWNTRAQFGLMPMDAHNVGISHRFQLGGVGSLRGFDERGVGPVDGRDPALQIGGSTLLSVQNELRYIWNDKLEFPLFLDVGMLGEGPFQIGAPRASVGLGIRLIVPGLNQPAYAYLAQSLISDENDDAQTIHFGFNVEF